MVVCVWLFGCLLPACVYSWTCVDACRCSIRPYMEIEPVAFRETYRLTPSQFEYLLSRVKSRMPQSKLRKITLRRLLLAFLPGTVHLVFRGVETTAVSFLSGLAQGCPLSCFLYILVIDPLLHKIRKHPGVLQLSAFADDWTIACQGLLPLFSLRPIIRAFELSSGQEINEPKSGIIPSRELSRAERLCCLVHWRNI